MHVTRGTGLRTEIARSVDDELRCGHCGYLLRGLPTLTCPECGRRFDPEELRRKLQDRPGSGAVRLLSNVVVWVVFGFAGAFVFTTLAILSDPVPIHFYEEVKLDPTREHIREVLIIRYGDRVHRRWQAPPEHVPAQQARVCVSRVDERSWSQIRLTRVSAMSFGLVFSDACNEDSQCSNFLLACDALDLHPTSDATAIEELTDILLAPMGTFDGKSLSMFSLAEPIHRSRYGNCRVETKSEVGLAACAIIWCFGLVRLANRRMAVRKRSPSDGCP